MIRTEHRLPFALSFSAFLLLGVGCTDGVVVADTGEMASETTSPGDGDGDPGDGDGDGDGDPGDGDGDGDGDANPCGDGVLDDGEACDDGNMEEGDGCSATCLVTSCGLVWSGVMQVSDTFAAFDIALADDGSIYAVGVMLNTDKDAWAVKWNLDGTVAWAQSFDGGVGDDYFNAMALGANGEIYVAGEQLGTGVDLWYGEISAADGSLTWDQVVLGSMMVMDGDDWATGVDITPEGDIVISGSISVTDGDYDVWVRKADAGDGAEIWTSTWTGIGDGMFSTDRSGEVSVADDGTIWVAAREHVDFNSQEATILQFDADGTFVDLIQPQPAGDHQHNPIDILADGGSIYFAMENQFPYHGWLYKLAPDGTEQWVKTEVDWLTIGGEIGSDWSVRGLGVDADGNLGVGGRYRNEEAGQGVTWSEAWVAKLDPAGELICRSTHKVEDGAALPPSLGIYTSGYASSGFGLSGVLTSEQDSVHQIWTGFFMP